MKIEPMNLLNKLLQPLHGKTPNAVNLMLIYGLGISFSIVNFEWFTYACDWSQLQMVLYFVISIDLMCGVIANMTHSTKAFWQSQPKIYQYLFLIVHAIQPVLLGLFFGVDWILVELIYAYMLILGIVLIHAKGEINQILSIVFAGLGIFASVNHMPLMVEGNPYPTGFEWFPVVYLLKLLVGFCIKIPTEQ